MLCQLAQQRMTLSDIELPFHLHRALSLRWLSLLFYHLACHSILPVDVERLYEPVMMQICGPCVACFYRATLC